MNGDGTPVALRPLRPEDIPAAVRIHTEGMPYSLNVRLGGKHLAYVYEKTMAHKASIAVGAFCGGELAGVVSATRDPQALAGHLMSGLGARRLCALCARLLARPWLVLDYFEARRLGRPVVSNGEAVEACLTAIVVAPDYRGRRVAQALVHAVDAFMRDNGIKTYRLDTRVSNERSQAFYRKEGFVEAERRGRNIIFVRSVNSNGRTV
ncbi:GNAT family N-acetyltransferase [bacterium]|nr:GNAT family N-acetyltransferase [bacterium]